MNKLKKAAGFIFCLWLVLFGGCSESISTPDNSPLLNDFSEIADQFERSYQNQSQNALDTAFTAWHQVIPPYASNEINSFSDTVRQIYDIFRAFYCPTDLNKITGGSHENFETEFRYIVVQNSLNFAVIDTNPQYYYYKGVTINERTIPDFRPQPDEPDFPVVYLSPKADSVIYQFLYGPDGTPREDHQQRTAFLRGAIQLTHHHWIENYHKATMPIVTHIYMNKTFNEALVTFRVFYQFGQAYLEWKNNKWNLINSELTAIE